VGCKEDYRKTKKTEDWIKCTICVRCMHEGFTTYTDLCQQCGKHGRKKKH
jgi:acetyl-CoA carboxylase beta subunit